MIEIKCTEKQKEELIKTINNSDYQCCILVGKDAYRSCVENCYCCLDSNIKWDIQPEPLKPCPFCGGESELIESDAIGFYVLCKNCRSASYATENEQKKRLNSGTGGLRNESL